MAKYLIRRSILQPFIQELFEAYGVKPRQARIITENIIMAEMRGVPSHGCSRIFTHYLPMIKNQVVSLESKPVRKRITPFLTVYDGNNGFGHFSSYMAMRDSIRLSEKTGFTVASVVNSTHFGIASYYSLMAAKQNLIGISLTNGYPAVVPPGGITPLLGTNALSVSLPKKGDFPLLFDFSLSSTSLGKLYMAMIQDEKVSSIYCASHFLKKLGLAENEKMDPSLIYSNRTIRPIGAGNVTNEYKGFLIGLIVELMICVIGDGNFSFVQKKGEASHLFVTINPKSLFGIEHLNEKLTMLAEYLETYQVDEHEEPIRIPGRKGFLNEIQNEKAGISVDKMIVDEMVKLVKEREPAFKTMRNLEAELNYTLVL